MKKLFIYFINLFLIFSVYSELNRFVYDYENNEVLFSEVTLVEENISEDVLPEYCNYLNEAMEQFCNSSKRVYNLDKKTKWCLEKSLEKYDKKVGEWYEILIFFYDSLDKSVITNILVRITSENDYKIYNIIEGIKITTEYETTNSLGQTEYVNNEFGYRGTSDVTYFGQLNNEQFMNFVNSDGVVDLIKECFGKDYLIEKIGKLTKEQEWLLEKGLSKYDLNKDECYSIGIQVTPKSFPTTVEMIVGILKINEVNVESKKYDYYYSIYKLTMLE